MSSSFTKHDSAGARPSVERDEEIERLAHALEESQRARDEQELQLAQVRHELASLLSSRSWRLTAPLRRVVMTPRLLRSAARVARTLAGVTIKRGPGAAVRAFVDRRLLLRSGAFDVGAYVHANADVAATSIDPVLHYLLYGAADARDPNKLFDTSWYLAAYPDVAESGLNPLAHYVRFGASEGRDPSPRFSTFAYLAANPDVAAAGANALGHYLTHGAREGRPLRPGDRVRDLTAPGPVTRPPRRRRRPSARTLFAVLPLPGRLKARLKPRLRNLVDLDAASAKAYAGWIANNDTLTDDDRRAIRRHISVMGSRPTFSIVMPVYNTPTEYLAQAIDSVVKQLYESWELCIADDASTLPHVREVLLERAERDPRIKLSFRSTNGGISACTNSALELASGDWVVLMDHDDMLAEHGLYMVASEIARHPRAALVYSDEDHMDTAGRRANPYFKPDWDYDLLLGQNMISHLGAYRADVVKQVGGFREGLEGSQDWDFALRAIEVIGDGEIRHVPHVLYHWRQSAGAFSTVSMSRAINSGQRAVEEHLARTGQDATVSSEGISSFLTVRRKAPAIRPPVSVIIPTKDRHALLSACLDGVLKRTDYDRLEVVIVDNGTTDPAALVLLETVATDDRVKVVHDDEPFNFSRLVNRGVAESSGDVCVLLNNDIDVIDKDWLLELVGHAVRPEVGAVGAKLYYADDTVQHAGVILGLGGVAGHSHPKAPRDSLGYFAHLQLVRNVSAVTAACVAVRREVYDEVGGFNADDLAVAFNDIDFCLRVRRAGYRIIWTPRAELYHYESQSRGYETTPEKARRFRAECDYMLRRWGEELGNDPFYNPNLSLTSSHNLAETSRAPRPWRHHARPLPGGKPAEAAGLQRAADAADHERIEAVNALFLHGTPNSGKTTAAKELAKHRGVVAIQTDEIFAFEIAPTLPNKADFWTYAHREAGEFDIGRYVDSDSYDHRLFVDLLRRRIAAAAAGTEPRTHVVVVEGYALRRHQQVIEDLGLPPERVLVLGASVEEDRYAVGPVQITDRDYTALHDYVVGQFREKCLSVTLPRSTYQGFASIGYPLPNAARSDSDTESKWLASHLDKLLQRQSRFVDIGCNAGYFCFRAAQTSDGEVVGVDRELRWLEVASHLNHSLMCRENVFFVLAEGAAFLHQRPGARDIVHCASTYHYFDDQPGFLQAAHVALADNGTLVLEVELADTGPAAELVRRSRSSGGPPLSYPNRAMFYRQIAGLFRVEDEFPSPFQAGAFYDRVYFHLARQGV